MVWLQTAGNAVTALIYLSFISSLVKWRFGKRWFYGLFNWPPMWWLLAAAGLAVNFARLWHSANGRNFVLGSVALFALIFAMWGYGRLVVFHD